MNLSRCFAPRQLLFLFVAGTLTISGERAALSQETITLRDGRTLQANILGVTSEGIKIQMGQAVMVQPFSNFTHVDMNPPPEYAAAVEAYRRGDLQTALTDASSVVRNYRGLPADWASGAMLLLGDVYVDMQQLPQAEADFKDYQRAYPTAGTEELNVGLARIDVAKNDFDAAKSKIQPMLDEAQKNPSPSEATAALIGQAFYVSGKIKEQSGDLPGALEDYLRTVTIFPEDRVAAAGAQERADAIRKEHGTAVP